MCNNSVALLSDHQKAAVRSGGGTTVLPLAHLNCALVDGRRPLHLARHLDTALLLVRLGASLSMRDNNGGTALEAAAGGSAAAGAALRQASISERHCAGCGAGGERLKRCIRCRTVSYCK